MTVTSRKMPTHCPSCAALMQVRQIACPACNTEVAGRYEFPPLCRLAAEDQELLLRFVLASGSLKEVAQQLGLSYPTVRNRLDDLIATLQELTRGQPQ